MLPIQEFINETWQVHTGQPLPDHLVLLVWSLIVSLYPLGGLFGALLAGPLAIILGRKKSLLLNNIFVVATVTLFGFSHRPGSFEMVMLGRLLLGVSAGMSMNVQPMYLGESAPKELRGAVAMTSVIFTALGIVIGQVVGLRELLGDPQAWHLLLASCLVPGVLQLAFLPLLPESPCYLLIDRGDMEACLAALQRLRGTTEVAEELAELEEERIFCQGRRALRPWELFQDRGLRRQVTSLMVLGSALELCGTNSVYAYASSVFRQAGIPEGKVQHAIVGTGSCELLVACVSCAVIEMVGRQKLPIAGYGLMACCGSIFTVALCLQSPLPWMPYLAMFCVFALILSFGLGPAGVTGILAMELFDQKARPAASMVCRVLMWTMLFLVGLGFPFIMGAPGKPTQAWALLPASCLVPGLLQLVSLPLFPESLCYLLPDCRDGEACLVDESLTLGPQTTLDGGVPPASPFPSLSTDIYQSPNPPEMLSSIDKGPPSSDSPAQTPDSVASPIFQSTSLAPSPDSHTFSLAC